MLIVEPSAQDLAPEVDITASASRRWIFSNIAFGTLILSFPITLSDSYIELGESASRLGITFFTSQGCGHHTHTQVNVGTTLAPTYLLCRTPVHMVVFRNIVTKRRDLEHVITIWS